MNISEYFVLHPELKLKGNQIKLIKPKKEDSLPKEEFPTLKQKKFSVSCAQEDLGSLNTDRIHKRKISLQPSRNLQRLNSSSGDLITSTKINKKPEIKKPHIMPEIENFTENETKTPEKGNLLISLSKLKEFSVNEKRSELGNSKTSKNREISFIKNPVPPISVQILHSQPTNSVSGSENKKKDVN